MLTGKMIADAHKYIREEWGEESYLNILEAINQCECKPMNAKEFFSHCTACGGDWGAMLLTGIRELYPLVWDAIPNDMGHLAFALLCNVLMLCKVDTSDDGGED